MFSPTRRKTVIAGLLMAGVPGVHAQGVSFSKKPITLVGPFPAGASTDVIARLYAAKLSKLLDTPVIVDNKPGASGMLAAGHVARAPADGHTLLVVSNTYLIAPFVYKNAGYDALTTFTPVTGLFTTPLTLAAKPDFPAKNLAEFVAMAKKEPGKYSYSTWGVGTSAHLQMELLKIRAGIDVLHVPYKNGPESSQAVMGGNVSVGFDTVFSMGARVRAGQLKSLVVFDKKRAPVLPEVQTNAEAGFPDIDQIGFCGIVAPGKMPKDILDKLAEASRQVVADPEYASRLSAIGAEALPLVLEPWGNFLRTETVKVKEVTVKAKISAD
ncbi:MAG: tripartite tricarboxylate transporter substrate binding protein [Pseudomonadota bacterium]